jgi:uncharacterized protein (DUF58 family)
MLTPQLDELLALRHRAFPLTFSSSQRRQTPLSGLYASVFRGQGLEFEEVREYRDGDEIRNIDWRVTARMNKPYLKVYREERERRVILCVDVGAHMQFGTRNTFKSIQAAYIAALLGWSAHGHGDRVGGLLFGAEQPRFFRPHRSSRTFGQLLRHLTQTTSSTQSHADALEQALKILTQSSATGALLFIIADFNQTPIALLKRALSQLHQRHEIVLISIDDPADYELPAIGTIRFTTPSGEQADINTDNSTGQVAYRQVWYNHRQALQQIAKHLYSDFFSLSTQDDVYQSLINNLQQRAQQQKKHR